MICLLAVARPERAQAPANQAAQYNADVAKTVVELQQFRQTSSVHVRSQAGKEGVATLINLNPAINSWYLLSVAWNGTPAETAWHLENPRPQEARILLDEKYPSGIAVVEGHNRYSCDLFGAGPSAGALAQGRNSAQIYFPLCDGRLYLRNPAKGGRTALEAATEFLRDQVWGGEKVIVLFHHLLSDRYRETGELEAGKTAGAASDGPLPALMDSTKTGRLLKPADLGISLQSQDAEKHGLTPGAWYPAAGNPGVYVSVIEPNLIAPEILASYPKLVNKLDTVEAASFSYLIAFDTDRLELGYALGTTHPEVGWSGSELPQMKNSTLPGPDGIGNIAPLISTGLIDPVNGRRTIATFTAGFKRNHGAFRFGALAMRNHGSHYGFIESGVVLSKLQPGLATVYVLDDGSLAMKTWSDADNNLLGRIRHARQNGVPLVEFDEAAKATAPGHLVTQWGAGNWSGSENEKLRTIRGGLALQKNTAPGNHGKQFLIYAVFSDATPSAMARVFQAYRCNYGMLTDMNALEHTYLALYRRSGAELTVEHLMTGMSVLDKSSGDTVVPRFLGYSDNRDFFYVMDRNQKGAKP